MSDTDTAQNTDRELWREPPGDYYANSIHVTKGGGVGINVGGHVIVRPLAAWHALEAERDQLRQERDAALAEIEQLRQEEVHPNNRWAARQTWYAVMGKRDLARVDQVTQAVRDLTVLRAQHERALEACKLARKCLLDEMRDFHLSERAYKALLDVLAAPESTVVLETARLRQAVVDAALEWRAAVKAHREHEAIQFPTARAWTEREKELSTAVEVTEAALSAALAALDRAEARS